MSAHTFKCCFRPICKHNVRLKISTLDHDISRYFVGKDEGALLTGDCTLICSSLYCLIIPTRLDGNAGGGLQGFENFFILE